MISKDISQTDSFTPIVRLHLWLDTEDGIFFGSGRAQLLERIERLGSLKRAAEDMGMSYRAAWGKIKRTEKVLGVRLIEESNDRRGGYRLSEPGRMLMEKFIAWFAAVEADALRHAEAIFPWPARQYIEKEFKPPPEGA
jgi:molybdate transport system regulatory protein